jgi:hypothetical protein
LRKKNVLQGFFFQVCLALYFGKILKWVDQN